MTEPSRHAEPGPQAAPRRAWPGAVVVGLAALAAFGWDLSAEPLFVDESAYLSQSYFAALFAGGRRHDAAWLEYTGYDLPPLPKYMIGAALAAGGYRTPGPADARAWYGDTSLRFVPPAALTAARVPFVVVGAVGCVALYGLGVLASGRAVGGLAAALLVMNPLYRLHARRAMSDVPCEAFLLVALFFALRAWKRTLSGRSGGLSALSAGVGAGLALLSKLSGMLALVVIAAWAVLALVLRGPVGRRVGFAAAAALVPLSAALVVVALDPFLTAHPAGTLPGPLAEIDRTPLWGRALMLFRHRVEVSAGQKVLFPHNALNTPGAKLGVAAVQGFGRFGPFGPARSDSTRRFDPAQDRGAAVWLPWVAAGACWAFARGRRQRASGEPPTAWALLTYWAVALAVVTAYLPMAWDRYLLPIQAPSALLAAGAAVALVGRLIRPGAAAADREWA